MKILSLSTLIIAIVTIFFEYNDRRFLWFFKPLTVLLIIAIVWVYGEKRGFYRWAILAGLVFSMIGDIFLIDPQNYFIQGLGSFFIAHLCYILAFVKMSKRFNPVSLLAFIIGFIIFLSVSNGVPEIIKIPVIAYTLAISTMLCLAFNFWLTTRSNQAVFAVIGAILFVTSDSIIAFNRFSYQFYLAKIFILVTYFTAQWLIARSVGVVKSD
jgi:uncharacterized membrane protein YhhN